MNDHFNINKKNPENFAPISLIETYRVFFTMERQGKVLKGRLLLKRITKFSSV